MPTATADSVRAPRAGSGNPADTLSFTPLHPTFMARASEIDLREVTDEPTLAAIRAGMAQYGVSGFQGAAVHRARTGGICAALGRRAAP